MIPAKPLPLAAVVAAAFSLTPASEALEPAPSAAIVQKKKRPGKPVQLPFFNGELADAKRESAERNVPLFVMALTNEGPEKGRVDDDGAFRERIRTEAELVAATEGVIVLIANDGVHDVTTIKVKNEKGKREAKKVCSWFHTTTCEQHKRNWGPLYRSLGGGSQNDAGWKLPDLVIYHPDGEISWRKNDGHYPKTPALAKALKQAKKTAGPGLSREQLKALKDLAAAGRSAMKAGQWGTAWRSWDGVLEIVEYGPFVKEANASMPKAEEGMTFDVEAAVALLAPGTAGKAYGQLLDLQEAYKGTPGTRGVKQAIKAADRKAELKEEIRVYKLEREAMEIWKTVLAAEEEGQSKRAERLAKKLLHERFAATKTRKKALEKFPKLREG